MAYGTSQPNVSGNTCPQTAASIMHRVYDFHIGNQDNGNVQVINNCRDTNRTQNFLYDSFNRISQAYTTGPNWGETFGPTMTDPGVQPSSPGIDAWGNLTNKSAVTGKTNTEPLNVAPATIKNQVTGVCNDAAGNLVQNSSCPITSPTYSYDIENRLTSAAAGYTYVYDGDGKRVKKCANSGCTNGTLYWTGVGSDPLVESGLGGSNTEEYIFFNGKRVARAEEPVSTTNVHYYFSDHLGSADAITNYQGGVQKESDYYPYGGEIVVSGSDINNYKFTGKERDPESGLDDFDARFYSSPFGRFMTPDWEAKPTDVPYANFGNPQSLNLYSYVQNNPTTLGDPDGHIVGVDDVVIGATIGVMALSAYMQTPAGQQTIRNGINAILSTPSLIRDTFFSSDHNSDNKATPAPQSNPAPGTQTNTGPVQPYETGTFNDLKGRSVPGDGLDIHHVPQAHPAEQTIPGYDRKTGPAMAVPEKEHQAIPTERGQSTRTAEQQVTKDVNDLRTHTNAPAESVRQAEQNAKRTLPKKKKE